MQEQDLIREGYTSYRINEIIGKGADRAYMKWFYLPTGERAYGIHVFVYDHVPGPNETSRIGFMAYAQFETENREVFNVERLIHAEQDRLESIESFFRVIFVAMICRPYGS